MAYAQGVLAGTLIRQEETSHVVVEDGAGEGLVLRVDPEPVVELRHAEQRPGPAPHHCVELSDASHLQERSRAGRGDEEHRLERELLALPDLAAARQGIRIAVLEAGERAAAELARDVVP